MHVDDLSNAILFALNNQLESFIYNVGSDDEISIKNLADIISKKVGYTGKIKWDTSYPNGTPRKKLDSSNFKKIGWSPKIDLLKGLDSTYKYFLSSLDE